MGALTRIVIIGGAGGGQIAGAVIEDLNAIKPTYELAGFLNDGAEPGSMIGDYPVLGRTDEASEYVRKGYCVHYALHNVKYSRARIKRFEAMNIPPEALPPLIHPTAYTARNQGIGPGALLAPYAILSFGAKVGACAHLYANSFIGHDSEVQAYASVATNAAVGSHVVVGRGCHIGINASIREQVTIGESAIVGIGAVVLKSVGDYEIAVGNPAKVTGTVEQYDESDRKTAGS